MSDFNERNRLAPEDALQILWDERSKGIGASSFAARLANLVAPALGAVAVAIGGWLWIDAQQLLSRGIGTAPIGAVIAWPTGAPLPDGWAECNGDDVDYSQDLANVLRGFYGNDRPGRRDTIKLPDFRRMFLRGASDSYPAGKKRQEDSVGPHGHTNGDLHAAFIGSPNAIAWEQVNVKKWHSNVYANINTTTSAPPAEQNRGVQIQGGVGGATQGEKREWTAGAETRPVNWPVHWIIRVR